MTRPRVQLDFTDVPIQTRQSSRDECDINSIMAKYRSTGQITHLNQRQPQFGDFDGPRDFQDAQQRVHAAEEAFSLLPAHIRDRMNNDPKVFLEFMANPSNEDEARALGLIAEPTTTADPDTTALPPASSESALSPPQPPAPVVDPPTDPAPNS